MSVPLRSAVAVLVSIPLIVIAHTAGAGSLSTWATHPDATTITVHWNFYEDPMDPSGHPEWIGFDLMRRTTGDCSYFTRLNDQPFPRALNQPASGSYDDPTADGFKSYEYRVVPVDAAHNPVALDVGDCEPCNQSVWASRTDAQAPATIGTLQDGGWALFLTPCNHGCWPAVYIENADALRQYADGSTIVGLYGVISCGSVEGCSLALDRFDINACDPPLPVRSTTWGGLKQLYR